MSLLLEALKQLEARPEPVFPAAPSPALSVSLPPVRANRPPATPAAIHESVRIDPASNPFPTATETSKPERLAAQAALIQREAEPTAELIADVSTPPKADKRQPFHTVWQRLSRVLQGDLPSSVALVTLPGASEGDWWLPLAVALTEQHSGRVLIVEGRSATDEANALPAITSGTQSRAGLSEVLLGRATCRTAIATTTFPRIDLLSRGVVWNSAVSGNTEQFEPTQLRGLWRTLKSDYSLVLLGAGGVEGQGVLSLAASCEATLLLFSLSQTSRAAALDMQRRLQSAGARLAGCLLCD